MRDLSETDLVGVWDLVSYVEIVEPGRQADGPLGPAPGGMLIYADTGCMSVSMMRTDAEPGAGETFMGYAGGWRLLDGAVVAHDVLVSAHRALVGTEQRRHAEFDGDHLVLTARAALGDRPRLRRLRWQRRTGAGGGR
ncbi:lipocalin-like domain-containing protein [Nocardia sp. NPDC057353]|uniref:lipocalin-like domain-containing protein n=1 Tax=Nocardia sp. NPDC057353 TaxID=3346104 RepID=UPI00364060A0